MHRHIHTQLFLHSYKHTHQLQHHLRVASCVILLCFCSVGWKFPSFLPASRKLDLTISPIQSNTTLLQSYLYVHPTTSQARKHKRCAFRDGQMCIISGPACCSSPVSTKNKWLKEVKRSSVEERRELISTDGWSKH